MHIHYIVITPFVKCQFESVEKQARRAVPSAVPLLHTLAPAGSAGEESWQGGTARPSAVPRCNRETAGE